MLLVSLFWWVEGCSEWLVMFGFLMLLVELCYVLVMFVGLFMLFLYMCNFGDMWVFKLLMLLDVFVVFIGVVLDCFVNCIVDVIELLFDDWCYWVCVMLVVVDDVVCLWLL